MAHWHGFGVGGGGGVVLRSSSLAAIAVALGCGLARGQEKVNPLVADWNWLRSTASAYLVLEPRKLDGVSRWAIESPRHRGSIHCMAPSPDGVRVATGGVDGVVRIWNLEKGGFEKAFASHPYHVYTMAWSPDGRMLATHAWSDHTTRVWEVETGKSLKAFKPVGDLHRLTWSNDSRKLAAGTHGSGRIYVSDGLAEYRVIAEAGQPVRTLQWSPDGTKLGVSAVGNPVQFYDASSGAVTSGLDNSPDDAITHIEWSPDGSKVATSGPRVVAVWEFEGSKELWRVATPCVDIAWSPDNSRILSMYSTGGQFWNPADGKPTGKHKAIGTFIDWNAKTDQILAVTSNRIEVWKPDGALPETSIDAGGAAAPVFQAGKPLVTGIGSMALSVWDPVTFKRLHKLEGHAKPVTEAIWSRDGKHFASASQDGAVIVWDVEKGEKLHVLSGHKGSVTCLEWSPDGKLLASAGSDKTIRIWTADGEAKSALEGHTKPILAITWSPNGAQIVSGGQDTELSIWDVGKGERVRKLPFPVSITTVAWTSVKGTPAVACGFVDGGILVVNPANGEKLATVVEGNPRHWWHSTSAVAWMPGPQPKLLASRYYLTNVWDVATNKSLQRQIAPGGATQVFPTAGGTLAVARSGDRTVRFWDPSGGSLRGVLLEEGESLVGISTAGDLKFDPDSKPDLIAIVETDDGQKTIPIDELQKYGWKNNTKIMKLPTRP